MLLLAQFGLLHLDIRLDALCLDRAARRRVITLGRQTQGALQSVLQGDHRLDGALAERLGAQKERAVAVLQGEPLPSIRIETPRVFYDYRAKYESDRTEYHCPGTSDAETEALYAGIALAGRVAGAELPLEKALPVSVGQRQGQLELGRQAEQLEVVLGEIEHRDSQSTTPAARRASVRARPR